MLACLWAHVSFDKAEINQENLVTFLTLPYHDILWFQVSMNIANVMKIFQALYRLYTNF